MSAPFDPYLQWLGIREPRHPPNHYRLLGLELFESDPNVIAQAADRQLAHVRTFQAGPHADAARELLNLLTAVRLCLLKADRKRQYDARLQSELQVTAATATHGPAAADEAFADFASQLAVPGSPAWRRAVTPRASQKSFKPWIVLAALAAVCVGLIYALTIKYGGPVEKPNGVTAKRTALPVTETNPNAAANSAVTPPKSPEKTAVVEPADSAIAANQNLPPGIGEQATPRGTTTPAASTNPIPGPGSNASPPLDNASQAALAAAAPDLQIGAVPATEPGLPPELAGAKFAPGGQAAATPPVAPQFPPVPKRAESASKEKEVRELFKADFQNTRPEARQALAKKLLAAAAENISDPTARYVLLNEARNLAAQAGDLTLALQATDELSAAFGLKKGEERSTLAARLAAVPNRSPDFARALLELFTTLADDAEAADDYDAAARYMNMATGLAKKLTDQAVATRLAARAKELALLKGLYLKAKPARDALDMNAADPEANETWGTYVCFNRGDFPQGLPFLAKGAAADLAKLAQRELAAPQEIDERLAIADEWWDFADKQRDRARANLRGHAGQLYLQMQPQLKGLAVAKAEKRLQECQADLARNETLEIEYIKHVILRNNWLLVWAKGGVPPEGESLVFLPDGKLKNQTFTHWSIDGAQLVLKIPNHPKEATATAKVYPYRIELTYFEFGKQLNAAVCKPLP